MRFNVLCHKFGHVPFTAESSGERAARARSRAGTGQPGVLADARPANMPPPVPPARSEIRPRISNQGLIAAAAQKETAKAESSNASTFAAPALADRLQTNTQFTEILRTAAPGHFIASLRGVPLPENLSPAEASAVREKLATFHPEILVESPFVDVHGNPIELGMADDDWSSWFDLSRRFMLSIPAEMKEVIENIFDDYQAHRQWQADNLEVRTVQSADVPADQQKLVGEEGLYAKKPIAMCTVVSLFEGMLLEEKADIETDKKIREMASCDNYYVRLPAGKIIEGMGRSMKMNSALGYEWKGNIAVHYLQPTRKSSGDKVTVVVFSALRDIRPDEQLSFTYDIGVRR